MSAKKEDIPEQVKELVITKIEAQLPQNLKLSIGSHGLLSKEEMIEHVKKGDEIGKQIVNVQMSFLKALASGEFVRAMTFAAT